MILLLINLAIATTCSDGTYSSSSGRGTCSHHGGIAKTYAPYYPSINGQSVVSKPSDSIKTCPSGWRIPSDVSCGSTLSFEENKSSQTYSKPKSPTTKSHAFYKKQYLESVDKLRQTKDNIEHVEDAFLKFPSADKKWNKNWEEVRENFKQEWNRDMKSVLDKSKLLCDIYGDCKYYRKVLEKGFYYK